MKARHFFFFCYSFLKIFKKYVIISLLNIERMFFMKKYTAIVLALAMCLLLLIGCAGQSSGGKEITETVSVLYVEKDGFITRLADHICYVEYPNADKVVAVGNQVELKYIQADHIVVIPDAELGGYQWDTVLIKFHELNIK